MTTKQEEMSYDWFELIDGDFKMSDLEHYLGRISEHISDISENVRRDSFFKQSACVAFGAKLSIDGNQFCFLLGDDLQSGIAGFGDTPSRSKAPYPT